MLNAESFRIPQELDLVKYIRTHPALAVVLAETSAHRQIGAERAARMDAARPRAEPLTRAAYPEAWTAVESATTLFDVASTLRLVAGGSNAGSYQDVVFQKEEDALNVHLPKAILARLDSAQLAGAIGHGLGHFLLGHGADADLSALLALVRTEIAADDDRDQELWDDPACADLLGATAVLAQLQDLSADRIGLLIARDPDTVLLGAVRSFSDVPIETQYLRSTPRYVIPARFWPERVFRPHPAIPNRAFFMQLFYESTLYRAAVGQTGGLTAAELLERSAPFLPFVRAAHECMPNDPNDSLLDLILMDSLVVAGPWPRPRAERMILRYLPPGYYEQLIERYDVSSDDEENEKDLLKLWLRRAARKSRDWKIAMIERFLYLVSLDRRIDDQALGEVATLANAMGAREECSLIYVQGFGYDPFQWSAPWLDKLASNPRTGTMLA